MNIDPLFSKAFNLVYSLQKDRPNLLTPLPEVFTPFFNHPYRVMKQVLVLGCSDKETLIASILHDVLEDTSYSEKQMKKEFGDTVTEIVKTVTKPKDYSSSNANLYYQNIYNHKNKKIRIAACFIKLADRIDNLLSSSITSDRNLTENYIIETEKYFKEIATVIDRKEQFTNLVEKAKELNGWKNGG